MPSARELEASHQERAAAAEGALVPRGWFVTVLRRRTIDVPSVTPATPTAPHTLCESPTTEPTGTRCVLNGLRTGAPLGGTQSARPRDSTAASVWRPRGRIQTAVRALSALLQACIPKSLARGRLTALRVWHWQSLTCNSTFGGPRARSPRRHSGTAEEARTL
jgi:hypothetical protein